MDNSPFALLSPELRNMIWKLAVTQNGPTYLGFREKPEPPITRVCKQIREESTYVFYSEGTFVVCLDFHSVRARARLTRWYQAIGPDKCALVNCLVINTAHIGPADFLASYVASRGTGTEWLEAYSLFGVSRYSVSFRGPKIIRTTGRCSSVGSYSPHMALTAEWVRGSDGIYRRVDDSESTWVQERLRRLGQR